MRTVSRAIPPRCARLVAVLLATGAALGGCGLTSVIDDASSIDYKSATKGRTLDVPPDLVAPTADPRFAVPDRAARTASTFESARAAERAAIGAPTAVLPQVPGARIVRDGDQRWLAVDLPPERVWPVVREFWQESGFVVGKEAADVGVIETDWAENRAKLPQDIVRRTLGRVLESVYSTGERDKFRTRIEASGAGTEVFVSHRGMIEVYTSPTKDQTMWQPRPSDPGLEAEFLRRLMLKFRPGDQATVAAAEAAASARARLSGSGADAVLEVSEPFDRAWRRVGLALDRGGFTVEDRDRTQGLYFVRYIDPEIEGGRVAEKPGILGRLFGSSSKPRADAGQRFRVRVEGVAESARVTVLGADGKPVGEVDRRTAARILGLLQEQLK